MNHLTDIDIKIKKNLSKCSVEKYSEIKHREVKIWADK